MGAQAGGVWGQEAGVSLPAAWWVHVLIAMLPIHRCCCYCVLIQLHVCLFVAAAHIRLYDTVILLLTRFAGLVSADVQRAT